MQQSSTIYPAPSYPPSSQPRRPGVKATTKNKKPPNQSSIDDPAFSQGYRAAYATIYDRNDYAAAIEQLKALGHDDHPNVANLIGYSYRKLGDYKLSQVWYERALKADPNHVLTWQYYGLWQIEQGNREPPNQKLGDRSGPSSGASFIFVRKIIVRAPVCAGEPRRVRARPNPSISPMDSIETNRLCDMAALCIFFRAFNITRRNSVMSVTAFRWSARILQGVSVGGLSKSSWRPLSLSPRPPSSLA